MGGFLINRLLFENNRIFFRRYCFLEIFVWGTRP